MKTEAQYHEMMDALFASELSPDRADELMRHVGQCEGCKTRYDRITYTERVLEGGPGAIRTASKAELDRTFDVVFSKIEQPKVESILSRITRFVFSPAPLAAAAALVIAVLMLPQGANQTDELQPRGAAIDKRPARIRAFCVSGPQAIDLEKTPECPLDGHLELAIGNPGGYPYAFVVGLQQDLSPRWYAPKPPATRSEPAPKPSDGDVPFGAATRLDVNHEAGALRIFAIFSDAAIDASEVEAAVKALADKNVSLVDAEKLPLRSDVAQRSVLIQVTR